MCGSKSIYSVSMFFYLSISSLVWTVSPFSLIYLTVLVQLLPSLSFTLYPVCPSMLQLRLSLDNVLHLKATFPDHHIVLKHHWLNVIISVEALFKLRITVQEWAGIVNSGRESSQHSCLRSYPCTSERHTGSSIPHCGLCPNYFKKSWGCERSRTIISFGCWH